MGDPINYGKPVEIVNPSSSPVPVYLTTPALPPTATDFEDTVCILVGANSTVTSDQVIPVGKTARLQEFGGVLASTSTGSQDIVGSLIWDPAGANELVQIARDISSRVLTRAFVGNGSKILRIRITNGTPSALILSASYNGYLEDTV